MSTTEPPAQEQTGHTHEISAEERAVVVGKCVRNSTGANEVIEVLVDIAG